MKNIISLTELQRQDGIEEELHRRDDLELLQMIEESKQDIQKGKTLLHDDVKKRLNFNEN